MADWRRVKRASDRTIYHLDLPLVGDRLEVTVIPPVDPPKGRRSPAIYVLDPFLTLDTVAGWARVYGRYSEGAVPPAFVIGVGHATRVDRQFTIRRIRDLTPTAQTGSSAWKPPLGAGNGPALLKSIAEEIAPKVEREHGASPRGRTIVGWSLGGLFALHALFQRPRIFTRYLVVSPSLWWDRRLMLRTEAAFAAGHDDLPARVFMAVGAEEQAPGGGWLSEGFSDETIAWFRQVSNFRSFTRKLRSRRYPALRLDSVIFPEEYHMTVYPAAVARGLVKLFEA